MILLVGGHRAVGQQRGVEQGHVRRVGQRRRRAAPGRRAGSRRPAATPAGAGAGARGAGPRLQSHVAGVDGPGPVEVSRRSARRTAPSGSASRAASRARAAARRSTWRRQRHLVVEALLGDVERGRQVEDGLPVLDGHDPAGGERAPVADAVDLVEDRHGGVAGAQEVGVQRVHRPVVVDGAGGGDEGLAGHLAAEHPLALLVGADAPEDVDLDGLEVEQRDEVVDGGLGHQRARYRCR